VKKNVQIICILSPINQNLPVEWKTAYCENRPNVFTLQNAP